MFPCLTPLQIQQMVRVGRARGAKGLWGQGQRPAYMIFLAPEPSHSQAANRNIKFVVKGDGCTFCKWEIRYLGQPGKAMSFFPPQRKAFMVFFDPQP